MNWDAIAFDWNRVRAFLATAEEGSLSAAARALNQTQPTLGRQVAALEEELGVVLFERIGRSLRLTASGQELLGHVRAMGDAANRISLAASGQSQSVEGRVMISASDIMCAYILPGALRELRQIAPRLTVEIVATDEISDLQRREADIAIRHVRPTQPDLIARLILEAEAHFYASTAYLEHHGRPKTTCDLSSHSFIGYADNKVLIGMLNDFGLSLTQENFNISSQSGMVSWEYACQGFGIGITLDAVARKFPQMHKIELDMTPIRFPIWLTTHRELHTSRRIRMVFDLLARHLNADKSILGAGA